MSPGLACCMVREDVMNTERTSHVGLSGLGCVVVLLLAPGTLDLAQATSGVSLEHHSPTILACTCALDPEEQDREHGQDLARAGERVDAARPGPASGRVEPASLPILASRRSLLMVAPKQGPPVPPLV